MLLPYANTSSTSAPHPAYSTTTYSSPLRFCTSAERAAARRQRARHPSLTQIPRQALHPITADQLGVLVPHLGISDMGSDLQHDPVAFGSGTSSNDQAGYHHLVRNGREGAATTPAEHEVGWMTLSISSTIVVQVANYCGSVVVLKHARPFPRKPITKSATTPPSSLDHHHDSPKKAAQALVREAHVLTTLRHPHIVQVLGTTLVGAVGYKALILEHVGPSLGEILDEVRATHTHNHGFEYFACRMVQLT